MPKRTDQAVKKTLSDIYRFIAQIYGTKVYVYIYIFIQIIVFFEVLLPSLHVFGASILYATIYW